MTTNSAAATAAFTATLAAWVMTGKPDLTMIINGALAGLVAIVAPCAFVSVGSSVIIGAIAGVLVVAAVLFFDRIKVDDPVGAISVHLVNGIFGTICVGLFAQDLIPKTTGDGLFFDGGTGLFTAQLTAVIAVGVFVFAVSAIFWLIVKGVVGLRVPEEEEIEGLDIGEHGISAYPHFPTVTSVLGHGTPGQTAGEYAGAMMQRGEVRRASKHRCPSWLSALGAALRVIIADKIMGMHVAPDVELEGLDVAETGVLAYHNFSLTSTYGVTSAEGMHATRRSEV